MKKIKHGLTHHPLYGAWKSMRRRCNSPNDEVYKYYGGRGIKVCKRWDNFALFIEDMGERPEGYTLDRIDNDKGYSPENCRWATYSEQQFNRRRHPSRRSTMICKVEGCERSYGTKGYCYKHYNRVYRNGTPIPKYQGVML